jgi:uncharacterized protein YjbJ (UPF0337 family)
MNQSTRHHIRGTLHRVQGAVKTALGKATDNPKLMAEGRAESIMGNVQRKFGQVARILER